MTSPTLDDPVLELARTRAGAGAWAEVVTVLQDHLSPQADRPDRMTLYAEALMRSGVPQRAREYLAEAVPTLAAGSHRMAHRTALNLLGAASFAAGALADAQAAWDRALELAEQAKDSLLVARATNNLGAIASLRGQPHDALYLYQLAVPVYQRLGDMRGLAETLHNLAIVYRDLGDLASADEHEVRAIQFAEQAGAGRLVRMARSGRAELALRRLDYPLAAVSALAVGHASAANGDRDTQADALRCAGEACTALGRYDEARLLLDEAITLGEGAGQALMQAEALLASARLSRDVGDPDRARTEADRAVASFRRLGAHAALARAELLLSQLPPTG